MLATKRARAWCAARGCGDWNPSSGLLADTASGGAFGCSSSNQSKLSGVDAFASALEASLRVPRRTLGLVAGMESTTTEGNVYWKQEWHGHATEYSDGRRTRNARGNARSAC